MHFNTTGFQSCQTQLCSPISIPVSSGNLSLKTTLSEQVFANLQTEREGERRAFFFLLVSLEAQSRATREIEITVNSRP